MPKIEKQGLSIPEMDSQVQGKSISTSNLSWPFISEITRSLTLIVLWGGGLFTPFTKFSKNCMCSHDNNTALTYQISMFDTTIVMTNT